MIPFRQKSGGGPSTAAKGCRVSPLALSDGSGKLVNMKTELDYQRSSNTWSWHSNKTKQSNQSEQFNKSEQHSDSNGVEPELVVVEPPPLRDLHWTLGSATEEESDDEAVKRARAAVMMTAAGAAAAGDGGYCSSTMAEMSSGGEEENGSRAFRPANEEEQQQPREETQKQQQQQQQENFPPRKWKKSFKICKCIPSKEEDQIIKLPATLVDLPPRPLIMSSNSGSRFRIIPVENRYKRGRWDCWDYYEGAEIQKKAFLQQQNFGPTAEAGRWLPSSSPSSPEKTLTTPSSQPLIHQQPHEQQQQTHNQQIPQPLPPPPMPRRNSFQLVTICRGLDDRRCSSSVPTSISEEKLNVLGEQQQQQQPQQQSSVPPSLLPTRALSRSRTPPPPQIVEPSTQSTTQIDLEVADRLRTMTTVTANGIASSPNSSSNLVPVPTVNIAAVVAATVSSPSHMIQQFGLERSLTLGLAQNDQKTVENGTTASQAQQPQQQQQQFSASFGPGQIQFGHNQQANRLQSPEERRTAALRRSSSASTGGTPASVAAAQQRVDAGVAIDSKIEQAMDLVKTHLIYAVRDEIEMLRSRIVQLETTVVQLERENAQLREFVPHEVLASLCLLDQQAVGQPQPNLLLNKVPSSPAGFAKTVPTAAAAAAAAIVQ